MLLQGLLFLLLNITGTFPPVTQQPFFQSYLTPFPATGISPSPFPVPPLPRDCSISSYPPEGSFITNLNTSLLCRQVPPGSPATSFSFMRASLDADSYRWDTVSIGPALGPPIKWVTDSANNIWVLTASTSPASGGSAGNGGFPSLVYYAADAVNPSVYAPPVTVFASNTTFIMDLQLSQSGLFAAVRLPPTVGIGTTIVNYAIASWDLQSLPRTPVKDLRLLPGTITPRYPLVFAPPSSTFPSLATITASTSPPSLDIWSRNFTSGAWYLESSTPIRNLIGQTPIQLTPAREGRGIFQILTRKTLIQLVTLPTVSETVQLTLPPGVQSFQAVTQTLIGISPTPTATATSSATSTASASSTGSATTTASASVTATATAMATATASSIGSYHPTYSPVPTWSAYAPYPTPTATASHKITSSPSTFPPSFSSSISPSPSSASNGTDPAAAAAAGGLTPGEAAGLGIGLSFAAVAIGSVALYVFARSAVMSVINQFRAKRLKPQSHRIQRPIKPPTEPNVIHLNMNPAMIQQQTTMDMLHLARQQRLEAIQAQQAELERDLMVRRNPASMRQLQTFKQMYKPQQATGSSV